MTIYYVVSEALTNIAKHASASSGPSISRWSTAICSPSATTVSAGRTPAAGPGSLGLADRVEALDGTVQIISPIGEGTSLVAELPLETQEG